MGKRIRFSAVSVVLGPVFYIDVTPDIFDVGLECGLMHIAISIIANWQYSHVAGNFMLSKKLSSPVVIVIFGNSVVHILWDRQTFAFLIESNEIKDSYMKYFYYFWKNPW